MKSSITKSHAEPDRCRADGKAPGAHRAIGETKHRARKSDPTPRVGAQAERARQTNAETDLGVHESADEPSALPTIRGRRCSITVYPRHPESEAQRGIEESVRPDEMAARAECAEEKTLDRSPFGSSE